MSTISFLNNCAVEAGECSKRNDGEENVHGKCGSLPSSGCYFSGEECVDGETEPRVVRS